MSPTFTDDETDFIFTCLDEEVDRVEANVFADFEPEDIERVRRLRASIKSKLRHPAKG